MSRTCTVEVLDHPDGPHDQPWPCGLPIRQVDDGEWEHYELVTVCECGEYLMGHSYEHTPAPMGGSPTRVIQTNHSARPA